MSIDIKIAKSGNVIIDHTDTIHGCLEQGGVCGRKVSVDSAAVKKMFKVDDVRQIKWSGAYNDCTTNKAALLYYLDTLPHKVLSKGQIIQ